MLGEDDKPEPSFLVDDGLHLSDPGYEKLAEVLAPAITRLLQGGDRQIDG